MVSSFLVSYNKEWLLYSVQGAVGVVSPFFSLKNIILGAHFSLLTFFKTLVFEALYFLKMCPIFVDSEVVRSSLCQKMFALNLLIY